MESLKGSLPDEVLEFLPEDAFNGDFAGLIDDLNEGSFLDFIKSYLLSGLDRVLKSFASVLALIVILSVFGAMRSSVIDSGIANTFSICSALCVTLTVFNICTSLAESTVKYMEILCNVMTSFSPIMASMMVMSGNITGAAITSGSMLLFISVIEGIMTVCMLPLVKLCISFTCVKALGTSCDFSGISKSIKTTFTSLTVFLMSVFMFVFSYKSILSQGADSLSLKTARFAISSFAPIVGSSINDALRTVSTSISFIKSSCGVLAVISIALIMLPVIINLFLNKVSFNILASVARLVGGGSEAGILDEADSICGFLLTLVSITCVLFIFAITIFIKGSVGIIS
ncbi:MAG: hypothetical protein J6D52_11495 [Clostridia bacterium]|nr:hypothetical protein [Clostridia bacterium]